MSNRRKTYMFRTRLIFPVCCLMLGILFLGHSQVFAASSHEKHFTASPHPIVASIPNVKTLVIFISGSTNHQCTQTMVLSSNGYATLMDCQVVKLSKIPTAIAVTMFRDVMAGAPLNNLPSRHCLKSASFGTTTVIAFGAQHSPDVSCSSDTLGLAIYHDFQAMSNALPGIAISQD